MNILYLNNVMSVGGVTKCILKLCKEMNEDIQVIVASHGGALVDEFRSRGIKHYEINNVDNKTPINIIKNIKILCNIVKAEKIDIIHSHHRMTTLISKIVSKFTGVRVIHTQHLCIEDKFKLTNIALRNIQTITVSNAAKKILVDKSRLDESKIETIYNTIEAESNNKEIDKKLLELKEKGYFIIAQVFDTFLVASGYYYSYKVIVGSVRNWTFDKTIVPFFIKESFPLLLSGAAIVIYQRIDQVMIGNMLNKTEVGYFATAGKFVDLILFLPAILVQTITPILVREKECDSYSYEAKKRTFVGITTWVSLLMALAISLSAYWMIIYTYGEKYALAIPVLQIMAFKAVGMALSAAGGQIIIIEHIQKWAFIRNVLGCFLCVILNYLFIPKYGIIGSAIVTVITVFFTGCISNIFIPSYHKILKLQIYAMFWGWKDMVYFKQIIRR